MNTSHSPRVEAEIQTYITQIHSLEAALQKSQKINAAAPQPLAALEALKKRFDREIRDLTDGSWSGDDFKEYRDATAALRAAQRKEGK